MTVATHEGPPAIRLLSDQDLERLDEAACAVVQDIGVAMPAPRAREALAGAGASIRGERVTIPRPLLHDLVRRAPSQITLGARSGAHLQTGSGSLLTTDGCCVEIHDLESGERRLTVGADVAAIARVVDALADVDFCWPAVSAQDYPAGRRGLWELYLAMTNTGKHVQTVTVVEPAQAAAAVEMAAAVAGGAARLREAPPISALLGTVTPLGNDKDAIEAGLIFAEAGVPVGFVSMPMGGSTTPITMAGSLAVGIAETMSAIAAIQAAEPGAPVFACFIPTVMDLKTGDFTGGAPEDTLMGAAAADIGRYYGVPSQAGVNASGAKLPGWQSAIDDVSTTLLSVLAGVDMISGVGMVRGGKSFCYEEMLLGTEIAARSRSLAFAMRWSGPHDSSAGREADELLRNDDRIELARLWAHRLLQEHVPPPLEEGLDAELRAIVNGRVPA